MFLAYLMVCSGVWANLQTLGEMTIAFPTSGNYVDYAGRWVDPALAFGAGFAEWLGETVSIWQSTRSTDSSQDGRLCSRPKQTSSSSWWTTGQPVSYRWPLGVRNLVSQTSWRSSRFLVSIFLVICLVVFILPNKAFAWLQCFGSMVKILLFILIVILSLALIGGAGPTGSVHDGSSWTGGSGFRNGFGVCAMPPKFPAMDGGRYANVRLRASQTVACSLYGP